MDPPEFNSSFGHSKVLGRLKKRWSFFYNSITVCSGGTLAGEVKPRLSQRGMQEVIRTAESRQHKGFAITKNQAYGLLQDCAKHHQDLHSIRRVQSLFVFTGLGSVEVLSNHLIRLFASCGSLLEATHVFNTVSNPSVHTWSSIISAHVDLGLCEAALRLYCRTVLAGFDSNKCICLAALKACTTPSALRTHGMLIHDNIIRNSDLHHDVVIGNSLVHLYAKCGSSGLEEACCLFRDLPYRNVVSWNAMIAGYAQHGNMELALQCFEDMHRDGVKPNVVSWGAVISGHVQHDNGILALQCFQKMQEEEIKPDKVIFLSALKACGSIGAIKQGRLIHDQIVEMELHCTAVLGTALVDMYVKCGSLQESLNVFINLPFRDVGPWNALITGYAQCGNLELALQGLENMQQDGIKPDVITWTAVIGGFIQNDDALLALDSFKKMQEGGVHPNTHTFSSVLKACGSMGAVRDGRLIHDQFLRSGIQDIIVGNALVDMYARCGSSKDSHELLKKLPYRNIVSWGAMIAGYSQCGNVKLALQCFDDMQRDGIKPNEAIFVSILTACSHAGLVDEAYKYFKLMKDNYGIIPNAHHHICLVDVLARAGHLNEAENLLSTVHFDLNGLRSLLTAGRTFGNVDLGRRCFDQVLHINPLDSTGYMLMSDIYSDASMPKYSTTIQELRQCAGVQKKPGKAWIEADNKVHEFIVGDKSHPQSGEIYAMLRRLITQIEVKGYTPKLNLALQELLGMDKEETFCQHVEIQATAVG